MTTQEQLTVNIVIIQHPRSGERYAVELSYAWPGAPPCYVRAAGPMHHADPIDQESLRALLDNQPQHDAMADAAWLQGEVESKAL